MYVNKGSTDLVTTPTQDLRITMVKKIAAGLALAGALAFSAAAPGIIAAGSSSDSTQVTAVGNWPDPMRVASAVGNWPDPMTYSTNVGNWPDPM